VKAEEDSPLLPLPSALLLVNALATPPAPTVIVCRPAEILVDPVSKPPAPPPPGPRFIWAGFVPPDPPPPTIKYVIGLIPTGAVHVVVPVNVNTQAFPSTETVKFAGVPTVWAQCAAVSVVARASGAFAIEITDKLETIKTKDKN
jgi:hypothetical protein